MPGDPAIGVAGVNALHESASNIMADKSRYLFFIFSLKLM